MKRILNMTIYYDRHDDGEDIEVLDKGTKFWLKSCELDDKYASGVKVEVQNDFRITYYLDAGLLTNEENYEKEIEL